MALNGNGTNAVQSSYAQKKLNIKLYHGFMCNAFERMSNGSGFMLTQPLLCHGACVHMGPLPTAL